MSDMPTPEPVLSDVMPEALQEPLDIQHDPFPADDDGTARRIPNLGHTLLFFALAASAFLLCLLVLALVFRGKTQPGGGVDTAVSLGAETVTYVLALVGSYFLFPLLWKRSFLRGIHWNGLVARRNWIRLVSVGVLLSAMAQIGEHFVTEPKSPEIDKLMRTAGGAWAVMLLGTLLAPLMEEIAFRGFLMPSLATAYDWLSLNRTPANVRQWQTTTGNSTAAWVFAALFSSFLFALVHAPQLEYAWGPVALLFGVSLVFAYLRVRTHSVACTTAVHLTYNLTIFIAALVATGGFRHLERL